MKEGINMRDKFTNSKIVIFLKRHWFITLIVLFAIIKQIITSNIPMFVNSIAGHDDLMMVNMAESLIKGEWLGEYSEFTLVKGVVYPLFMAVSNSIGISTMSATTLLYTLSCLIFILAIKDIFKSKYSKIYLSIIYVVLLFNPVSFAFDTFQRVYRNGLTLSQVLIIFGSFIAIYLRRDEGLKSLLPWSLLAGIGIASLWNTREDAIWILPFLIVVTAILIVIEIYKFFKSRKDFSLIKIIIYILPIILLVLCNKYIASMNYKYYGIRTTNELNDSYFTNAMKAIYSVVPEDEIRYVSVTRNKLKQLYTVSPTLASVQEIMEERMDAWADEDRHPEDNEVEDGWFFWVLRNTVTSAGYYSDAQTANNFYRQVAEEINDAIREGKVQNQRVMPSALMSPWRDGYVSQITDAFSKITKYVISYDEVTTENVVSISNGMDGIERFEALTNDTAIFPLNNFGMVGWYVNLENTNDLNLYIETETAIIGEISFIESEDIYKYILETENLEIESAKKCRFSISIKNIEYKMSDLYFVARDMNNEIVEKLSLKNYLEGTSEDRGSRYSFDVLNLENNQKVNIENAEKYINRLNRISNIYKKFGTILAIIGFISYLYISIKMIKGIRIKKYEWVNIWLILTGIFLSLIVLMGGVSYNEIASCTSVKYLYLSGSYPLIICFELISLLTVINWIIDINKE